MLNAFTTFFAEHAAALAASLVLLCLSFTFSSCETSLFSLSAPELNRLRAASGRLDRIVLHLHGNLKKLLPSLLFCNMAVNVGIFSLSTSFAAAMGARYGGGVTLVCSLASLFVVVFFGEVFPKQMAISSSFAVAKLTAMPVWLLYRAIAAPMRVLNAVVVGLERVLDYGHPDAHGLREEELRLLVELSRNDGAISEGEYMMIDSIVELPDVRIRDVMMPRVDIATLPAGASLESAVAEARRCRHCKLPVLESARDDFVGWLDVRDVYADRKGEAGIVGAGESVESYLRHFQFFSEHDRADQVLERIKGGGRDLFAVVDERGVVVGFFTLQDIMDEVLGHFGEHGAPPPSEIREMRGGYIISGRLSVREWRDVFNVSSAVPRSATVGGLVVSLLGRIPRRGDRVELDNMEMTVLSTWHNRVTEVGLRLINSEGREQSEKKVSSRMNR